MIQQKPSIPKGTRDFTPDEMVRRNYIFDTIRSVFQVYGYLPIETPAMEYLTTLLGKYGEEGDKLLFRILNSGDFLGGSGKQEVKSHHFKDILPFISEKGMRYDLTVPFARFVVQHQHEIVFPFKRYQIQPVWRADRPQKSRYREFFQCDVDVIGSNSPLYDVEMIQIIDEIFTRLNIPVLTLVNNRKILAGMAQVTGIPDRLMDLTTAMDKLDKVGIDPVVQELQERGIPRDAIEKMRPLFSLRGKIKERKAFLDTFLKGSPLGLDGLEELCTVLRYLKELDLKNKWDFDLKLARGLDYYTGTIIEVKSADVKIGSMCGGGRYDDMTGIFGMPGISGTGVSFGADRIYDVLMELDGFPATIQNTSKVLLINFGPEEERCAMKILTGIRKKGISSEMYPEAARLKKQLDYANRKHIPFVVMVGQDEIKRGTVTLKNMATGEQKTFAQEEIINVLNNEIHAC